MAFTTLMSKTLFPGDSKDFKIPDNSFCCAWQSLSEIFVHKMGDHGDDNLPASSPTSIIKHLETRAAYEELSILDRGLLINYLQHKSGARVTAVLTEPIWKLVGRVEKMRALKGVLST